MKITKTTDTIIVEININKDNPKGRTYVGYKEVVSFLKKKNIPFLSCLSRPSKLISSGVAKFVFARNPENTTEKKETQKKEHVVSIEEIAIEEIEKKSFFDIEIIEIIDLGEV